MLIPTYLFISNFSYLFELAVSLRKISKEPIDQSINQGSNQPIDQKLVSVQHTPSWAGLAIYMLTNYSKSLEKAQLKYQFRKCHLRRHLKVTEIITKLCCIQAAGCRRLKCTDIMQKCTKNIYSTNALNAFNNRICSTG